MHPPYCKTSMSMMQLRMIKHVKKNVSNNHEKKHLMEKGSKMTQMFGSAEEVFKEAIINVSKELKTIMLFNS